MQSDEPLFQIEDSKYVAASYFPFTVVKSIRTIQNLPIQQAKVFGRFKMYLCSRQKYSDDSKSTNIVDKSIRTIQNLPIQQTNSDDSNFTYIVDKSIWTLSIFHLYVSYSPTMYFDMHFQEKIYIYIYRKLSVSEYFCIWQLDFLLDLLCFNATFSNISAISWRPVLVVEEAGVPGENHRPWASNW